MPSKGTAADGYGYTHRKLRRALAPDVAAGRARCWRCRLPIAPGEPWDLGHADEPDKPTRQRRHAGPEHRRCNRATMGRERTTGTTRRAADASRQW